jgi:hypothetical protein
MLLLLLLSLITDHFSQVLLLNQRWSPPFRCQVSDCSNFRTMCDVSNTAVFCSESIERVLGVLLLLWLLLLLLLSLLLLLLLCCCCCLLSQTISPRYFSWTSGDPRRSGVKFQTAVISVLCVMFQIQLYSVANLLNVFLVFYYYYGYYYYYCHYYYYYYYYYHYYYFHFFLLFLRVYVVFVYLCWL